MKGSSNIFCGLLMSCLCLRATASTEELSMIQCSANITVYEGDSIQIKCCWTKTSHPVKVSWFKNEEKISAGKHQLQELPEQHCSTLNITNITKNDTGDYVCKVIQDIPYLLEVMGNKTVLTVIEKQSDNATTKGTPVTISLITPLNTTSNLILPLSLAAAIGLLTFCLAFSIFKIRNSFKNAERMVNHQMPHSEGGEHENMEEEELSTNSSQGSLQWYHVPLYWSYFDLQRGENQCQPE
ncbi:uncharacterized protein LOC127429180 isoform X2 [Myxocyprinus asiaticus]|uniref:uncharacterized protein LOC127429180 isoform X2 n=1 Tax=Myxocyprinus asiaticus TaxID=70543 RepID=UPI002222ADB3|nr:uncharacterized protein LOC127429180 isoform X2 [Myxocyprinus asiaticus]